MVTNALVKTVRSLAEPKGRRREGAFVAEGSKCVMDTLDAFVPLHILATPAWADAHPLSGDAAAVLRLCGRDRLTEMSSLTLAPDVIAVYRMPQPADFDPDKARTGLVLALDRVQDPGNLGTIMRTADWMGVDCIWASRETVDCFNPKTVQASMGAVSRVRVIYGDLPDMLGETERSCVAGTFLDGENVYTAALPRHGVVVMGNEGRGISPEVEACIGRRLTIPSYPAGRPTSESLNVGTAAAIVLAQFRARIFQNGQD